MSVYKRINILNRDPVKNGFAASLSIQVNDPLKQAALLKQVFGASTISDIKNVTTLEMLTIDKLKPNQLFFVDGKARSIREAVKDIPMQFRLDYKHRVNEIHKEIESIISVEFARKVATMTKKEYKSMMLQHDNTDYANNEPLHSIVANAFDKALDGCQDLATEARRIHNVTSTPKAIYERVLDLGTYGARASTIHNDILKNIKSEAYSRMKEYNETFKKYVDVGVPIEHVVDYYTGVVQDALQNSWGVHATGFDWHKKGRCEVVPHESGVFEGTKTMLVTKSLPHNMSNDLGFAVKTIKVDPWGTALKMSPPLAEYSSHFTKQGDGSKVMIAMVPHRKRVMENREPKFVVIPATQFDSKAHTFDIYDGENKNTYDFNGGHLKMSTDNGEELKDTEHTWEHVQVAPNIHLYHHKY